MCFSSSSIVRYAYKPNRFWSDPHLGAPQSKRISQPLDKGSQGEIPNPEKWRDELQRKNAKFRKIFIPIMGGILLYVVYLSYGIEPNDWITEVPETLKVELFFR
jgi:hypothetical protein